MNHFLAITNGQENLGVILINQLLNGLILHVTRYLQVPRHVNGLVETSHCTTAHARTLRLQWAQWGWDGNQTLKPNECDDFTMMNLAVEP